MDKHQQILCETDSTEGKSIDLCVCVCMRVCERESEKKREEAKRESVCGVFVCVCVCEVIQLLVFHISFHPAVTDL